MRALPELLFEKAGPREMIFFEPARTRAAIVTCGGLCPGLNTVIRSLYRELFRNYGVKEVWHSVRLSGHESVVGLPPMKMTPRSSRTSTWKAARSSARRAAISRSP